MRHLLSRPSLLAAVCTTLIPSAVAAQTCELVSKINVRVPSLESCAPALVEAYGRLYFGADDGVHGEEVWTYDPATRSTRLVADLVPGSSGCVQTLTLCGTRVYARVGCLSSTSKIVEIDAASGRVLSTVGSGRAIGCLGDRFVFQTGGAIYAHDASGIKLLVRARYGSALASRFVVTGGRAFFTYNDAAKDDWELWTTEGTAATTRLVADIQPGATGSYPRELTPCGARLFFHATRGAERELWVTDGSSTGTRMLDLNGAKSADALNIACVGDRAYFAATVATTGRELYSTDGTIAGTKIVTDLEAGPTGAHVAGTWACDGRIYYWSRTARAGLELAVHDPHSASTRILDFTPGSRGFSSPEPKATCAGQKLFVRATTDGSNYTLYAATERSLMSTGVSDYFRRAFQLHALGDRVYFYRTGLVGQSLWTSDGTSSPTGTRRVCSQFANCFTIHTPVDANGEIYFVGSRELYRVRDTNPSSTARGAACGPGWPTLAATSPRLGHVFEWRGERAPDDAATIGVVYVGLPTGSPLSIGNASNPRVSASCRVYFDLLRPPVFVVAVTSRRARWTARDAVPNDPRILGARLVGQGVFFTLPRTGTGIVRMQTSNGVLLKIGR